MQTLSKPEENFFKTACYFEASLILVALLLGWIADINPFATLYFSETALLIGVIGTMPLFLFYALTEQLTFPALQKIKALLLETLCPPLAKRHWTDLIILSAIAGFSEELLFRGLLQPWLERSWGLAGGLIGSSILFGLVHALTPLYAILAALISLYLGLSMDYGDNRNLLIPMIIHGFYDFLVFKRLIKTYNRHSAPK